MPASMSTLPSGPVRTAMLPPEPSSTLTLLRSLCVTIGETAALSLIRLTRPRASAKASRGVSHPLVATNVAPAMQQRQKCRRESRWRRGKVMASSFRDAADVEALMRASLEVNGRIASARDPSA
jgi:hypothetical protein